MGRKDGVRVCVSAQCAACESASGGGGEAGGVGAECFCF